MSAEDRKYGDCEECHGFGLAYLDGTNTGRGKVGVLCPICDGTGKSTPEAEDAGVTS